MLGDAREAVNEAVAVDAREPPPVPVGQPPGKWGEQPRSQEARHEEQVDSGAIKAVGHVERVNVGPLQPVGGRADEVRRQEDHLQR